MSSVGELSVTEELSGELRGARAADPKNYPATLYSASAGGSCTSTLVGQQVLLTAAHCVSNGGVATFRLGGKPYRAVCEHASEYTANPTVDYALCAIDKPIPALRFERVNADPARIVKDASLLLTGFGCTKDNGTGGNDGVLREGEAQVVGLPSGDNNDIETKGKVGLCFGDSGGPAFAVAGARRWQVSVNSRVSKIDQTTLGDRSFLSSTSTPMALAFLRDWSKRNGKAICGLDPAAVSCR